MPIEKAEIERVKADNDLAAFVRLRGVELKKKGRQFVGLCPFHNDREPSFFIDTGKQLWNCLGACKTGGDIYNFVMKADGVDFPAAHRLLGGAEQAAKTSEETAAEELFWLERATAHYHQRLLETMRAQDYLQTRGIRSPEFAKTFRLGFSDGTLLKKLPPEGKAALTRIGVITEKDANCFTAVLSFRSSRRKRMSLCRFTGETSCAVSIFICPASGAASSIRTRHETPTKSS